MEQGKLKNTMLEAAIAAVHRTAGIKLKAQMQVKRGNKLVDAEITIDGLKKVRFTVEVKKWAQQANFGAMVNQLQQLPGKGMLVADYVDPMMADRLRDLEIPYIDTVGNVYINEKPFYVLVKNNRVQANNEQKLQGNLKTQQQGRAFNPTGLKVVYALMQDEKLLNAPYREIAEKTQVALGTVGWVINDLKQGKFLTQIPLKKRRLNNKKQLLDKWVDAYLEKLRPKLFVGTFSTENDDWWKELNDGLKDYGARWGGEVAAAKLTGHLKPEEVTVYLPKVGNERMFMDYRFRKDPNGKIHVYQAFWDINQNYQNDDTDIVDPIIVYADLIGTGDVRNIETARILYQNELNEFIKED
jgi:hypothetical protein